MKRTISMPLVLFISVLLMSAGVGAAPTESQSVTVNDVKINYIEQGAGEEILVFVHGYMNSTVYWTKVLELLPEEYHAYALDLRGHGQN